MRNKHCLKKYLIKNMLFYTLTTKWKTRLVTGTNHYTRTKTFCWDDLTRILKRSNSDHAVHCA